MKFFESETNPAPPDGEFGFVESSAGVRVRYAHWSGGATGLTIVLLNGRSEHIEKYFETIGDLVGRGYNVLTLDWRGQGLSTRVSRHGYVDGFDEYRTDLLSVLTLLEKTDDRIFFLCQSMGSLICLYSCPNLIQKFSISGIVFSSPLFGLTALPHDTLGRFAFGFARLLGFGGFHFGRVRGTEFEDNVLTTDPDRFARNEGVCGSFPDLVTGAPTISWLWSVFRALSVTMRPSHLSCLGSTPCLMICGESDRVVCLDRIDYVCSHIPSSKFVRIPDARHELFQERDVHRNTVMNAIFDFLDEPSPASS